MHPSPEQPKEGLSNQKKTLTDATQQRRQSFSYLRIKDTDANSTLGDILLPFLFAAMETCWLDAIFIGPFQSYQPLMPLWAPFVLIIGSQWILSRLEQRANLTSTSSTSTTTPPTPAESGGTLPGSSLFILFVTLTTLFITWITLYAPSAFFLDPRWLFALFNDILLLDLQAYHVFFIIAITLYLCWRSVRFLHRAYEPSQVFGTLRLGMGIIVAIILLRAGQNSTSTGLMSNDFILLMLIPIFLFLSLTAHSLARISFLRRTHPFHLGGDISSNERSILLTIAMIGLTLFLISWLTEAFASPTILTTTRQLFTLLGYVYDWLIIIVAAILSFLTIPVLWLITWLLSLFRPHLSSPSTHPPSYTPSTSPSLSTATISALIPFLKVLVPILLALAAVLLIRWIVRRRKRGKVITNRPHLEEFHESLWSWSLFWTQLRALFRTLFGRFFPSKTPAIAQTSSESVITGEPGVRTIREMYRALLQRAAARGYPRRKDETPYEFNQRLHDNTPLAQPQLVSITESYTSTRYGDHIPDEAEVTDIRQEWTILEQKWREGVN